MHSYKEAVLSLNYTETLFFLFTSVWIMGVFCLDCWSKKVIVFIIGNLPVLAILAIFLCVIYLFIKRKKKENNNHDGSIENA